MSEQPPTGTGWTSPTPEPAPQPPVAEPQPWGSAPPPGTPTTPPPSVPPPPVAWQTPPAGPSGLSEVPGAPGRFFAATVTRVAALLVDSLVIGFIAALAGAVIGGVAGTDSARGTAVTVAAGLAGAGVSYLYFALLWRSEGKATLGQRAFRMQVGNAFDGATLTWRQATIRWLTLFGLSIVAAIPYVGGLGGLLAFVWAIVLLLTTATSATRQGFHDRWANSAVVATGPQNIALAWGCLIAYIVAVVLVIAIAFAALVAFLAAFTTIE